MRPDALFILTVGAALAAAGCKQEAPKEVVVTETRRLTSKDSLNPKVGASDEQRFRNAAPSPLRATAPDGWLSVPATQFRLLNYRFGASGTGEVFVSLAGGSLLENANRWLGQFGAEPLAPAAFEALEKLPVLGGQGVWLTAEGTYHGGMGQPARDGYGLAGILTVANGQLVTIKMVGPAAEVAAERERLRAFATTLSFIE